MTADEAEQAARTFRALAHTVRLTLLDALVGGERSVGDIERACGIAQPGLSQQLAILRDAGMVATRREAKQVYYRIEPSGIADVAALLDRLGGASGSIDRNVPHPLPAPVGAAVFARIIPRG